jgi:hypothetical protein
MARSRPLLTATIGFGVLYVAATAALGSPPDAGLDAAGLVAWFRDHGDRIRVWVWLLTLLTPFFAAFVVLVRARLPSLHGDLFFFGALALAVETSVMTWLWAGLAWHADQLQPVTTRLLFDVASYWGPVLTSTTITLLLPLVLATMSGAVAVPRWVGWLGGAALVEQVVETITVFGNGAFLSPGGLMNTMVGPVLVGAFLVCLGITLGRRDQAEARASAA